MNVSRSFLLIGSLYLLVGILFGMYMGGSGDHSMAPLHAHINLLGFALMMVFGLVYKQFPEMAKPILAKLHFWLHQVGTLTLLIMLFLLFSGRIEQASMAPISPIAEAAILAGSAVFTFNLYKNSKG